MPRAVGPERAVELLEKVGFRHEGLAVRHLRLDGVWSDQELGAMTAEDASRASSFV